MSQPMAAGYNPIAVEAAWYDWGLEQGFFKPPFTSDNKVKPEGLFVITAPPPNVTGSLHIGHALTTAIQDCLVRWYVLSVYYPVRPNCYVKESYVRQNDPVPTRVRSRWYLDSVCGRKAPV